MIRRDAAGLPRVAVAADGTLAAIHEATRITVLELPGCAPFAEIGVDPEAEAAQVAWLGAPPRLVVLGRYAAHTRVHLIDPYGPRTVADIRLEAPMKLFATVGTHALAVGALGAAVLTAGDAHLTPYQFPTRAAPVAAGAAGGQFVIALAGSIEEWDPQTRMPRRKLKLPRAAPIAAVGGSDRVVWLVTQAAPQRIEVLPLVHRGQPKGHDLPEPIAQVASHPRSDLVACVGAETGRMYVIDLDGRIGLRMIGPERIERVEAAGIVVGRSSGVLAMQAGRAAVFVPLDGRDAAPAAAPSAPSPPSLAVREVAPNASAAAAAAAAAAVTATVTGAATAPEEPARRSSLYDEPPATAAHVASVPVVAASRHVESHAAPPRTVPNGAVARHGASGVPTHVTGAALSQRFSTWRERLAASDARPAPAAERAAHDTAPPAESAAHDATSTAAPPAAPPAPAAATILGLHDSGWRDALVAWTRSVEREPPGHAQPDAPPLAAIARRFALPPALVPALALAYGAHLAGEPGAAPVDVARVLGGRWDEALGAGALATSGVIVIEASRVRIAPAVQRALDGLSPRNGVLVGAGEATLSGPHALVSTEPPSTAAHAAYAAVGGAILAAHDRADPGELALEARAHGAIPLVHASARPPGDAPALVLVAGAADARALGLPLL